MGLFDCDTQSCILPKVHLAALTKLKRLDLVGWMPQSEFTLPPECKLYATLLCDRERPWEQQWRLMQRHLTMLYLEEAGGDPRGLAQDEWPRGLESLTRLQYFGWRVEKVFMQDLAGLKGIPNVNLTFTRMAYLTMTGGTWQSLEILGEDGLCIRCRGAAADAFVRGTTRFLFVSTGDTKISGATCAKFREASRLQSKDCFQSRYKKSTEVPYTVRLSNCEEMMRLQPSSDGEMVPAGGLCDGYAGTPEDSPLWGQLTCKSLVSWENMIPVCEPFV